MPKKILPNEPDPQRRTRSEFIESAKKISRYCRLWKLSSDDHAIALGLMGERHRAEQLLWSDLRARYHASKGLASIMTSHQTNAPTGRTYYMLSFCDDSGYTSDRVPYLSIQQTIEKVRRAIASLDLHAFVMLEVHPVINYPRGGAGRSLLLGAHAIAWTDRPFNHNQSSAALCASPAWSCTLGADPVHISVIAPGDIARVAHYLMKQRPSAKNLTPNKHKLGKLLMMETIKGYRNEFAVRLFEGQSQVELMNMMFGVGDGSEVRQTLRAEVTKWHRARTCPISVPSELDVWAFWQRLRQDHGSKHYLPYRFDGGSARPVPTIVPPVPAINASAPALTITGEPMPVENHTARKPANSFNRARHTRRGLLSRVKHVNNAQPESSWTY